jgi:hypothetical protein
MKGLMGWVGGRWVVLSLALLMLVGAALRLVPIGANRFHQDEALYSFWALQIATGRDPILDHSPVDKPPLFIYTLALCFKLFGPSEVAARLPSELGSVVSIALVYYLASRLYGRAVAVLAAILMALSPFNILFAPTAFTDPMMVAWVLAALCLAASGRWARCGLMMGLAAATKQQDLLFVPLTVGIGLRRLMPPPPSPTETGRQGDGETKACPEQSEGSKVGSLPVTPSPPLLVSIGGGLKDGLLFVLGFVAVMAPVAWWDSLRWKLQPNYFERSLISYGGLTLVDPTQWVERIGDWAHILHYVTASRFLNILLLSGLPCLLLYDLGRRRGERATWFDVALSAFVVLFLLGHWVLSFNVWDRYLLGLVPLLLILLARIIWLASGALASILPSLPGRGRGRVGSHKLTLRVFSAIVLLVPTLTGPALAAARSGYPIGGDHGAYDGIEAVAAYFRDRVPAGSILYHHWLGWHYSFYMFDFPLVLRWYPSPVELAQDARQVDNAQRYIVFPSDKSAAGVEDALAEEGLALRRVSWTYRRDGSVSFSVYRIEDQK